MTTVAFSFDPACPWTWRTSRWLVRVAAARDLRIEWRPMSLAILNEGHIAEEHRARTDASHDALRLVAALAADGRQDDIGRFYRAVGERMHDRGEELEPTLLKAAAESVGLIDEVGCFDDPSFDAAVRAATDAAVADAGPDIGSPVLHVHGVERGLHGPIVAEGMTDDDALALWDAITLMLPMPQFFEVKRGRR
jgi:hypothetical protein